MAGHRIEPRLRLGTAFVAAQLPDVLWPCFLLARLEHASIAPGDTVVTPLRFDHYPWSHSLSMVVLWGVAMAWALRRRSGNTRVGLIAGGLVVSHWLLDYLAHRPDMPLVPWSGPRFGLSLWNSLGLTVAVEGALFVAAVVYLVRERRAGKGFWTLITTLLVLYLANLFGPPPPNMTAVAVSAIVLFPLVWFWGNSVEPRPTASRPSGS
jgi:membrane-bound metal-dependent hydrolase YbcI (DUF457 family)